VLPYEEIVAGRLPFRAPFDIIAANFSLLDDASRNCCALCGQRCPLKAGY